jgi:hypothetical protein
VEEEIENILNSRYGITVATSRLNDWFEHPRSIHYMSTNVQGALKPSPEEYIAWITTESPWGRIDSLIRRDDLTLCLTFKHLYIRECKKWFERFEEERQWKKK